MVLHDTVLLKEAIDLMNVRGSGCYLDCTGGMGGHAREILSRLSATGQLWISDYHKETVERLKQQFAADQRVNVIHSRFSLVFDNLNFSFDGILADFGVSSPQLDDENLGIGFLHDGIFLDMRLDGALSVTAADVLRTSSESNLADIFYYFGGERGARKIAAALVSDRKQYKFYDTSDALRDLCARVLGGFYRGKKIHPATKVFQALRIAVNHELDEIKILLEKAPEKLTPGGRLVLISFHQGEDTLVKTKFRELHRGGSEFLMPVKKVIKPSRMEVLKNPRARSAKMRVLERTKSN